jgi:hypothetical protein
MAWSVSLSKRKCGFSTRRRHRHLIQGWGSVAMRSSSELTPMLFRQILGRIERLA